MTRRWDLENLKEKEGSTERLEEEEEVMVSVDAEPETDKSVHSPGVPVTVVLAVGGRLAAGASS